MCSGLRRGAWFRVARVRGEESVQPQVALVQMPFAAPNWPSLGLSLLKSGLARRRIPARIHYLNLWYLERIDFQFAWSLLNGLPSTYDLLGEWIFAAALWGPDPARDAAYVRDVLEGGSYHHRRRQEAGVDPAQFQAQVMSAREQVEPFVERCLTEIPWEQYRFVGFTSVFQQQLACLALARRLKERHPHLFIAMGGANCEGEMGTAVLQNFPFIDAVCSGEGDLIVPDLVEAVLQGRPIGDLPGILHRQPADPFALVTDQPPLAPAVHDMDALPYPDFDDFFADLEHFTLPEAYPPRLMFETSRGCWWGQKQHCTFCGLNGSTMRFRQKSAARAMDEVLWLLDRYGPKTRHLSAVDNIIPYDYFQTFLPRLKELELDLDLFYETKANLRKEQVALYRAVGLRQIQPGIESLSTPVLTLMRKGVSSLQNLQLLKWCRQYGITPYWNYLYGFPGERPEDYAGAAELIRAIAHLTPPTGYGAVRFDRFSPYLTQSEQLGLRNLAPYPAYEYIYPGLDASARRGIAYYFTGDFDGQDLVDDYTAPLRAAVDEWRGHDGEEALFSVTVGERLLLVDLRTDAADPFVTLAGPMRRLFEACDGITGRAHLLRCLAEATGEAADADRLDAALAPLLARRLLVRVGNEYLALPVPLGFDYAPTGVALERFAALLATLRAQGDGDESGIVLSGVPELVGV